MVGEGGVAGGALGAPVPTQPGASDAPWAVGVGALDAAAASSSSPPLAARFLASLAGTLLCFQLNFPVPGVMPPAVILRSAR